MKQHPCPAGAFTWWASKSEEGPFMDTHSTDRATAIREAIGQSEYDEHEPEDGRPWQASVVLVWARRNHVRLDRYFDAQDWIERISDQMEDEDGPDEFGDQHPTEDVTKADIDALEESVRSAIWHWQNRRQIRCKAFWLEMPGYPERVTFDHPENGETP